MTERKGEGRRVRRRGEEEVKRVRRATQGEKREEQTRGGMTL